MAHPFAQYKDSERKAGKARYKADGGSVKYQSGGAVAKKASGGGTRETSVQGRASGGRLDKFARGGKAKSKHSKVNINIINASKKEPDAVPPPLGGPMPGGPPPMAGPPPGMPPKPPGMMKRGGKVGMSAGADTGVGRLQKARIAKRKG